jgi:hypothetical protein
MWKLLRLCVLCHHQSLSRIKVFPLTWHGVLGFINHTMPRVVGSTFQDAVNGVEKMFVLHVICRSAFFHPHTVRTPTESSALCVLLSLPLEALLSLSFSKLSLADCCAWCGVNNSLHSNWWYRIHNWTFSTSGDRSFICTAVSSVLN